MCVSSHTLFPFSMFMFVSVPLVVFIMTFIHFAVFRFIRIYIYLTFINFNYALTWALDFKWQIVAPIWQRQTRAFASLWKWLVYLSCLCVCVVVYDRVRDWPCRRFTQWCWSYKKIILFSCFIFYFHSLVFTFILFLLCKVAYFISFKAINPVSLMPYFLFVFIKAAPLHINYTEKTRYPAGTPLHFFILFFYN